MRKEEIDRIKELVTAQMIDSLGYLPGAFRLSSEVCLVIISVAALFFSGSLQKAIHNICIPIRTPHHMAVYLRDLQLLRAPAYHFVTHSGTVV